MRLLRARLLVAGSLAFLLLGCGGGGDARPEAPGSVDVGLLSATVTSRVVVQVANPLAEPALVTDATFTPGMRVDPAVLPLTAAAGEPVSVPLLFAPNAAGPTSFPLAVRFAGATRTVVRDLTVRATFDAVAWTVSPSSFEFGAVPPAGARELSVTAWNRSAVSPVTISAVDLPSAHFTLVSPSLPVTVGAGSSATFFVRYEAGPGGWHDGTCLVGPADLGARLTVPIHAGDPEHEAEEVLDLGPAVFSGGETDAMSFPVPDDAVSVTVEARGAPDDDFVVAELLGPGGVSYLPRPYVNFPVVGFGLEVCSYTVPDTDVPRANCRPQAACGRCASGCSRGAAAPRAHASSSNDGRGPRRRSAAST